MKPISLRFTLLLTGFLFSPMSQFAASEVSSPPAQGEAASRVRLGARAALERALAEDIGWVRVHAAEALITIGEAGIARATYERELLVLEVGPARVGAWRVLAFTARSDSERAAWVRKIAEVLTVPGAADRLQALESLCKLRAPITGTVLAQAQAMSAGPEPERPLGTWALHLAGDSPAVGALVAMLGSTDPVVRLRSAYALRWIGAPTDATRAAVAAAIEAEPADSLARPYLLSAALVLEASPAHQAAWLRLAEDLLQHGVPGARYELSQTMPAPTVRLSTDSLLAAAARATGDERIGAALLAWRIASSPPPSAPPVR
jgi:hypothetical protein